LEESVFTIKAAELQKIISFREKGLMICGANILKAIALKGQFQRRDKSEQDPSFKQIITYAVISSNGSYFLFRRGSGQREKRLENRYSLGVGGHVNPIDDRNPGEKFFVDELNREFFEEILLLPGCTIERIEFIGLLNDDTITVGRVHIGLLFNIHLSNQDIEVFETDKMTASWADKAGLAEHYDQMESWSQFVFDDYLT